MRNVRLPATIALMVSFLAGCSYPDSYPPPPQIGMPSGPEPEVAALKGPRQLLAVGDPDASKFILGGIFPQPSDDEWRFTDLHPRFRLEVTDVSQIVFYMRFFNHLEAINARGPVSFTVDINGKKFESPPFRGDGDQEFRRPLPDGFIVHPGPVVVTLDIHQAWHYPGGETYGLVLHSIGFQRQQ